MTRPMPEPPEHRRNAHPHGDGSDGWCPICHHLHARRPDGSNRLTDAECAAEYWRAEAEVLYFDSHFEGEKWSAAVARQDVIDRFATHPHHDEENA